MKCEACGHDNVEGARFCANCGVVLASHPKDTTDPMIGQVIGGRFRIKRVLGEGGMGIVYEAEQQMGSTIRKVAVKTLHKQLSTDPSVAARFHRECGTVAGLEHPNTVKVYDFGTTPDGHLYIAMEFLQGDPLNVVIEKGAPLEPTRVINIVRQIAGSLDEAHQQGIIHRDLKPENVVLISRAGEKDVVKLLDFGIAARTESADAAKEAKLTQQGMVLGTPPYMSPEQFTGKALDKRSDIYSLGVMTYEMVTGQLPFEATTPWQWATEHMTAKPKPFDATPVKDKLPQSMQAAILRSLEKDREKRQSTTRVFVEELQSLHTQAATPVVVNTGAYGASAASSVAEQHTAAMDAVPDFGATPARTADMPAHVAAARQTALTPGAVSAAVPGTPSKQQGSKKGLVLGLGALVGVLAIVMVIVLVKGQTHEPDVALTNPFEQGGGGKASIAPEPAEEVAANPAAPSEPTPSEATSKPGTPSQPTRPGSGGATGKPPATGGAGGKPSGSGGSASTPASGGSPSTTPTSTPEPTPSGGDACAACIKAVRGGNITGAAKHYQACTVSILQKKCADVARTSAPSAAQSAALNGNCKQAAAIAAAATAMGAGTPKLDQALAKCK
ncbi:MAG TPA: protein kinase [Polyangiaceae bacterium]|nr:protein kinase [Polyangiaceae bacterium]